MNQTPTGSPPPLNLAAFIRALHLPGLFVEIRRLPTGRSTWHDAANVDAIVDACLASSRCGLNVYCGAVTRPAAGARGDASITSARCVFVDYDGKHLRATDANQQIAEALKRAADACFPPPSIVVHSGHGVHLYWLFANPMTDMGRWAVIVDAIITALGSDPACSNAERIMRCPDTINRKAPEAMARLIECHPDRLYDPEDLAACAMNGNLPEPAAQDEADIDQAIGQHADRIRGGASVIEPFLDAVDPRTLLASYGYNVVGDHFRRPGKEDRGFSGIFRRNNRGRTVSVHFSTNDTLNDRKFRRGTIGIHDAFSAFALLTHNGNYTAAVRDAAARLGIAPPKQKRDADVIREIQASPEADEFARIWFGESEIEPAAGERRMRAILAMHTSNPVQVDRILAQAVPIGSTRQNAQTAGNEVAA